MEGRYTHQVLGFLKKAQEMKTSKLRSPICKSLGTSWGFSAIKLIKNHDAESCHNNLARKKWGKKKLLPVFCFIKNNNFPLFLGLTSVLRLHQDHLEVLVKISDNLNACWTTTNDQQPWQGHLFPIQPTQWIQDPTI